MKKIVLIALSLALLSCQKEEKVAVLKTAYIDSDKLMEKYQKAIDLEEKYKVKSEEMGRELESDARKYQSDYASASQQAQVKGPQWAQQKGIELQKREQELGYKQEAMAKEIRSASAKEMDSLVTEVTKFIKDYGKKKGYDYIFATGSMPSVIYAKESYDLTNEFIKLLNESYTSNKDSKKIEK